MLQIYDYSMNIIELCVQCMHSKRVTFEYVVINLLLFVKNKKTQNPPNNIPKLRHWVKQYIVNTLNNS